MIALLSRFILWLAGWKVVYDVPHEYRQFVLIMAPHTSNWDFLVGRLALWSLRLKAFFLIKKEAFFFPLGPIVKAVGGIPVDRAHGNNVVSEVAEIFRKNPIMVITITPEGTRSLRRNWKRGFWYIARQAQVPVVMGYLDYGKKVAGVHRVFWPSESYEQDLVMISDFYRNITARHPEKFNLSPVNRKE
ncbi:MAG: 1-acyl-sn-glycerol-3-phosphate acyltransferase [Bacteroidales bacterium]|nr:1-acyl-sn-glycerol-3-phosphate acyltransferase [Bacteroidales bacterium]MDZ4204332.1 1-acyl-sn-glycerol-3-phosphate acyltransferase [Bacteroidales bacterium]